MEAETELRPEELVSLRAALKESAGGAIVFLDSFSVVDALVETWSEEAAWGVLYDGIPVPRVEEADLGVRYAPSREVPEVPKEAERPWLLAMTEEFKKAIRAIDRKLQGRILEAISHILSAPTKAMGDTVKPLTGDLKGVWRYRIGDWRLLYQPRVEAKQVVLLTFTSRGDAYP